jgi:hypothetical protein
MKKRYTKTDLLPCCGKSTGSGASSNRFTPSALHPTLKVTDAHDQGSHAFLRPPLFRSKMIRDNARMLPHQIAGNRAARFQRTCRVGIIAALCAAGALMMSGCTMGRVNSRVAYWQRQTDIHIPVGTTLGDAQGFFASQGLQLRCCTSGRDIHEAYSANERNVGRFFFTEYSVMIVVDVSTNQTIDRVRVFRVGVGL